MNEPVTHTLVAIKGDYEGKTYAHQAILSDFDPASDSFDVLMEVKRELVTNLGDALKVPRKDQDADWVDRFRLFVRGMTQAEWERYVAGSDHE
jgi:hypothetical protein